MYDAHIFCYFHKCQQTSTSSVTVFVRSFSFKFHGLHCPIYCLLPPFYTMPKEGLSAAEWRRRLSRFAQGDRLGCGQRPRRNSYWARTLESIEKCPRHRSAATHVPFGRPLACKSGFHKPTPALDPSRRTHAPILVTFSN